MFELYLYLLPNLNDLVVYVTVISISISNWGAANHSESKLTGVIPLPQNGQSVVIPAYNYGRMAIVAAGVCSRVAE